MSLVGAPVEGLYYAIVEVGMLADTASYFKRPMKSVGPVIGFESKESIRVRMLIAKIQRLLNIEPFVYHI